VAGGRIELTTLLLCDYALTSQDGKISAIGIFSQINVQRLPALHGRLFIVAVLEADPGAYNLTLQVVGPDGKPLMAQPPHVRIQVPQGASTANIVADLKGFRISELGRHRIEIHAGERVLGGSPFTVRLIWRQQQPASA
jgi:hypothetical protein